MAGMPSTYFVANDGNTGHELWRRLPNGEVERVADIAPGATSSDPGLYGGFVEFNGALYFRAAEDGGAHRLYRVNSDGTVEQVAGELYTNSDTSLTVFDGALYFTSAGVDGNELYRVTASGTVETVADLVPFGDSDPANVIVYNGDLYFTAWDPTFVERFVYRLDDSASAPVQLDGLGTPFFTGNGDAIGFDNAIYFTADDGATGLELYKLDILTGLVSLAADIYPFGSSFPQDFNIFNGALYFSAYDPTVSTNILYRVNVGGVVEPVPDIIGGAWNPGTFGSGFIEFDGALFFSAYVPSSGGYELCRVDETGTIQLVDLDPGSASEAGNFSGFAVFNGELYFSASTPSTSYELYKLTTAGDTPTLVADLAPFGGSTPGQFGGFIVYNNALYFVADDFNSGFIRSLMRVTSSGAVETVADLPDGTTGTYDFAISAGDLYLTVDSPLSGRELYRVDANGNFGLAGDVNQDLAVSPLNPLPYANSVTVGGELYFTASTPTTGTELWKVSAGGTFEQVEIRFGVDSSDSGALNGGLFSFNGDGYFAALNGIGEWQLFRLPAAGGIEQVIINPSGASFAGTGPGLFTLGTSLYFMADGDNGVGTELWRVTAAQPSTPEFVFDFNADASSSQAGAAGGNVVELGGALYIVAHSDTSPTRTFFKIEDDGVSPPAVSEVADIPADVFITSNFTTFDGDIYFAADDLSGTTGRELYRLNLSLPAPAVELVADIQAGPNGSGPTSLTIFNGALYFVATDGGSNAELHRITAANAHLVPPVVEILDTVEPGINGSFPGANAGFIVFDNALYFSAYDSTVGWELRRIPASTGAIETVDLAPAIASGSFPQRFHIFNGELYVVAGADDGAGGYIGVELHRIPSTGLGDGLPALVADLGNAAGNPSIYSGFIEFNGSLYFTADGDLDAPAFGHHFYRIDSTGAVHYVTTVPSGLPTFIIGVNANGITFQEQGGDVYLLDASANLIKGLGDVANNETTQGSDPAFVTEFDSNTAPEFVDGAALHVSGITIPAFAENTVNAAAQPIISGTPVVFALDHEGDWNGGTLSVGGLVAGDVLSLGNVTVTLPVVGAIDVVISGTDVYVDSVMVGQYTLAGASFEVVFNAAADTQAVTAVINAIHYASTSNAPQATRNLTVTLGDSHGALANLTLTIGVTAENDAPTPRGTLNLTVNEDGLGATGSATTTDPDGDTLTYALQGGFAHGTVAVHPTTGVVTYTPTDLNFDTDVNFTIRASDPSGLFTDITVNVDVVPLPDDPIANDDPISTLEDTAITLDGLLQVTVNDSDPDGDSFSIISVTDALNGTVALSSGIVTYTPDSNYFGSDSFTYTIEDSTGRQDTATVTVNVTAINDAPAAGDDVGGLPARPDVVLVSATGTSIYLNDGSGGLIDTGNDAAPGGLAGNIAPVLGDFDGDGDLDIVTYTDATDLFTLRQNSGHGVFSNATSVSATPATNGKAIAAGDVDADGDLDVVTQASGGLGILVSKNGGSGTFTTAAGPAGPEVYSSLALADIDGDTDLDLIASGSSGTRFYANDGSGAFTTFGTPLSTLFGGASDIATGDLNGDGDIDLVLTFAVGLPAIGQTEIYLNNGSGAFTLHAALDTTSASTGVEVGDLDGDNDLDLLVTTPDDGARVYKNDGSAGFTSTGQILGPAPNDGSDHEGTAALADFDADGDLDAVITHAGGAGAGAYKLTNDGTGLFTSTQISTDGSTISVAAGHLNRGGLAQDDHDAAASDAVNTAITGNLFANDTDADGPGLAVWSGFPNVVRGASFTPGLAGYTFNGSGSTTSIINGDYGTLTVNNATGDYSYVVTHEGLGAGFTGTDVFSVRVTDNSGGFDDSTLTIHVTGSNDEPTFDAVVPEFHTAGRATDDGGNTYTLNPESNGLAGGIFTGVDLSKDFQLEAKLFFGTSSLADGMAFVIQNVDPTAIGANAHFFGVENPTTLLAAAYPDYATGYDDLGPAFGVKFDTFVNAGLDTISGHHAQFFYGGRVNGENQTPAERTANATATGALNSATANPADWKDVSVTWNASTNTLTYSISGGITDSITYDVVNTDFGANPLAYMGFAGSGGGAFSTQRVMVLSVTQGSAPSASPIVVTEHVAGVVATAKASDVDNGDTLTYSFTGAVAAGLTINTATGEISADETTFDYERELDLTGSNSVTVTVRATDLSGAFAEKNLTFQIIDANPDDVHGTSRDEIIFGGAGDDTLRGDSGADRLVGAAGADALLGGTGDDTFIVRAGDAASGESYDGGADTDTLRIDGGGTVDLTGVTFSNLENAVITNAAGTRVILSTAQINAFTGTLDAQGSNDTFAVSDLAFLGTFGTPATRASAFALITDLHNGGVENVEWQEGGATTIATVDGSNVIVTSADNGANNWVKSVFTFNGTTGERLTKVTTMDDGSIVTRNFTSDVLVTQVTTGIVGPQDTSTIVFDSAGRWDSLTIVNDGGSQTQYDYDDFNRADTRTETAANGFETTTSYNDSNQRTSVTSDDTASNLYTWATSTLTLNPANGQVTQKVTVFDDGNTATENYTAGLLATRVTVDGGANEAFSIVTQLYSSGVFQSQTIVYDNGTGIILGADAANTIQQTSGINDAIIGKGGADVFVFAVGGGADRVLDFSQAQGDQLDLTAFGVDEVLDISSYTQVGANLILNFGGGDTVQINGITFAALTNADLVV
jgi:ELWxxDGT repeat protein